jgi:hypothetical protein
MKLIKHLVLFFIFLAVGFLSIGVLLKDVPKTKLPSIKEIFDSSKFSLLDAPSESLRAGVKNLNGDVVWKNRIAETPTKVDTLSQVQQGESLITGEDGSVDLDFLDTAYIKLQSNSEVDIIQTLPANIVFKQLSGVVTYQKISTVPVSVRVSPILIEVLGNVSVSINDINGRITISGLSKVAYNDKANTTRLIDVSDNQSIVFNPDTLKVVQE